MSEPGRSQDEPWFLSPRGRLVVAERIIRFGPSLSTDAFRVLLFIYDRTLAWNGRCSGNITREQFLEGVVGPGRRVAALPIGLTAHELNIAIEELLAAGVIRRNGTPIPLTFAINFDWEPSGFMPKWRVEESDYIYDENLL